MRVTREGAKAGDRAACECGGKHKVDHRRVEPLRDDSKVVFQALLCVEHISQAEVHCEETVARRHTRWPRQWAAGRLLRIVVRIELLHVAQRVLPRRHAHGRIRLSTDATADTCCC